MTGKVHLNKGAETTGRGKSPDSGTPSFAAKYNVTTRLLTARQRYPAHIIAIGV